MKYLNKWFNLKKTPQSAPIPGTSQVRNDNAGYVWAVDDWTRLDRFLILGSEGGSYYASERTLTRDNAEAVLRCIAADGPRVVARIVAVSDAGRAPKNDPALFALALAAKLGDEPTRRAAHAALPRVARIGTHLFHFAEYVKALGGWGRGTMRAFARWYNDMDASRLAVQAVKYQSRDGWSHRDVLRKAHPVAPGAQHQAIYNWMVKGWDSVGETPHPDRVLATIWAFERAKRMKDRTDVARAVRADPRVRPAARVRPDGDEAARRGVGGAAAAHGPDGHAAQPRQDDRGWPARVAVGRGAVRRVDGCRTPRRCARRGCTRSRCWSR